jgi:ABC-type transport system involved in multi-copper enzyme maturation permease subunit
MALLLVPLIVWRNVSYASESLDTTVAWLDGEVASINAQLASNPLDPQADDLRRTLADIEDQLVTDRFDIYISGVPGSAHAIFGLLGGAAGLFVGMLLAGGVAGSDLRSGSFYWWLSSGRSRSRIMAGKLLALPVIAAVVTLAVGVLAGVAGVAFNAWYRSLPWFLPAGPDWGHLAVAWFTATLLLTLWAIAFTAATFAMKSASLASMALGALIVADAFLTTKVPGAATWLLTMRVAQAAEPLWPPASRYTVDTVGFLWWVGPTSATRFPAAMWLGCAVFGIAVLVVSYVGWRRLLAMDYVPASSQ